MKKTEPIADVPNDLAEALKRSGLDEFFSTCTGPHRREYLKWIGEAKRPETRAKRIQEAVERLARKRADEGAS